MKREIIPTSPQFKDTNTLVIGSHMQFWPVLGLIGVGALAGMLTAVGTTSFILSKFDIHAQQIVLQSTGSTIAASEIMSSLTPAIRERSISVIDASGSEVAQGLIATTDGWVVTPHAMQTGEQLLNSHRQIMAVTDSQQDPFTELYFLKVDQTGLPVVTWSSADEIQLGQRGMVMQLTSTQADWVAERSLANVNVGANQTQSLLHLQHFYELDAPVLVQPGTPLVGLNSKIIGVMTDQQTLIPGSIIDQQLSYFIDHHSFQVLPDISTQSLFYAAQEGKIGLLVTQSAVEGIQVGDILTGVDGQAFSKPDYLVVVLFGYAVGESVKIDLERSGQAIQTTIVF